MLLRRIFQFASVSITLAWPCTIFLAQCFDDVELGIPGRRRGVDSALPSCDSTAREGGICIVGNRLINRCAAEKRNLDHLIYRAPW